MRCTGNPVGWFGKSAVVVEWDICRVMGKVQWEGAFGKQVPQEVCNVAPRRPGPPMFCIIPDGLDCLPEGIPDFLPKVANGLRFRRLIRAALDSRPRNDNEKVGGETQQGDTNGKR